MTRQTYIDTAAVLIVSDIRQSAEWYRDALGFSIGDPDWSVNPKFVIAQNEETCTVYGMPKEPVESGMADVVAPLDKIAEEIVKTVK